MAALRAGLGIGYCQSATGRDDPNLVPVLPDVVLARVGVWLVTHEDCAPLGGSAFYLIILQGS
jgi:DNA-binding transcriptional LysR family regulator